MQKTRINKRIRTKVLNRQKKDLSIMQSKEYQQLIKWLSDSIVSTYLRKKENSFKMTYYISESESAFIHEIIGLKLFKNEIELTNLSYNINIPKHLYSKIAQDAVSILKKQKRIRFMVKKSVC